MQAQGHTNLCNFMHLRPAGKCARICDNTQARLRLCRLVFFLPDCRMAFRPEPARPPGQNARTAVVLCNLGTPDAPTPAAVRSYLAEFLGDPRVVEIPPAIWKPLLHGVILRTRPAASARKYAAIWTPEGSPLLVWTQRQAALLQQWMQARGHAVLVRPAMRYGRPGLESTLDALKAEGVDHVLVLPAYPQYSGTTTASVLDAVFAWSAQARVVPEWRFINRYHDHPLYIQALANSVRQHWQARGQGEQLVLSFHGVPERTCTLGDTYYDECVETARLLTEVLALPQDRVLMTFQSRFGKAKWLEPYTQPSIEALARQGVRHIDVMCPGFSSDCLETLEEINMEVRHAFMAAGGTRFEYIPCLNANTDWIEALGTISLQHLAGWLPTAS